ncbi:MAG: hypothetical protein ACREMA_08280 [Longimicrobiales bacterium]
MATATSREKSKAGALWRGVGAVALAAALLAIRVSPGADAHPQSVPLLVSAAEHPTTPDSLGIYIVNVENQLKAATRLERLYLRGFIRLADEYRVQGRDLEGERVLREGLALAPGSALLHHVLGLTLVRLKRTDAALAELATAAVLDPTNKRYTWAHAVVLREHHSSNASNDVRLP